MVVGFLDLAGRHAPRYQALMRWWNPFVADMDQLKPEGFPVADIQHIWDTFVRKWHVPQYMGFERLLAYRSKREATCRRFNAQSPAAKISKDMLEH
ncbi:hypothetical protein HWV62_12741 [Athelia sp. TMB]|nr:hypothetical protein HWV62_12741 [Athelia sp. TMB]